MTARIALDVGSVRIGVAAVSAGTRMAMPVETVPRGPGDIERIAVIARERRATEIIVGDPITLAGEAGPAAVAAREFAQRVADALPDVAVRLLDERLTTAVSGKAMRAAGRNTRKSRNVLDQAAAVTILQNALDMEHTTGNAAGAALTPRGDVT